MAVAARGGEHRMMHPSRRTPTLSLVLALALLVASPALAGAQVSTPGQVGLTVGIGDQTKTGTDEVTLEADGRFAGARISTPATYPWLAYHTSNVTHTARVSVTNGWSVLDDTVTLTAPATVKLAVLASGSRSTDVGLGTGCASAGARTAPGYHRDRPPGEGEFVAIPVALPAGTSPLNAIVQSAEFRQCRDRTAAAAGRDRDVGLRQAADVHRPAAAATPAGSDQEFAVPDACSSLVAETLFDNVTTAGDATLTSSPNGPAAPAGYVADRYLNFAATAAFASARPCLKRNDMAASSLARLYQRRGDAWVDVTATDNQDFDARDWLCAAPLHRPRAAADRLADPPNWTPGVYEPDFGSKRGLKINGEDDDDNYPFQGLPAAHRLAGADHDGVHDRADRSIPRVPSQSRFSVPAHTTATAPTGSPSSSSATRAGAAGPRRAGGGLGYGGIGHSVAVEFDIHDNTPDGFSDQGDNHVAIHSRRGPRPPARQRDPVVRPLRRPSASAWVDYDAGAKKLAVYATTSRRSSPRCRC